MKHPKEVRCYTIKLQGDLDFIPGFMVLKIDEKFYSFGRTVRSYESVYREVKDRLETLTFLSDEDLRSIDIGGYYVRSIYLWVDKLNEED